eukprot:GILI01029769.1.p1 GENE.GILI01029769.1~~GILI01029769.1.p1  ORF type:complete len:199 (-),score=53.57 GILI01029769.1:103-699(-)
MSPRRAVSLQELEKDHLIKLLLAHKPWLDRRHLQGRTLAELQSRFHLDPAAPLPVRSEAIEAELHFIQSTVKPQLDRMREKKSDVELMNDVRYYGKYGDFLLQRFRTKTHYQLLEVPEDAQEKDIKRGFRNMALRWHPDNVLKDARVLFANQPAYMRLLSEIFHLVDGAYRVLLNPSSRQIYDLSRKRAVVSGTTGKK